MHARLAARHYSGHTQGKETPTISIRLINAAASAGPGGPALASDSTPADTGSAPWNPISAHACSATAGVAPGPRAEVCDSTAAGGHDRAGAPRPSYDNHTSLKIEQVIFSLGLFPIRWEFFQKQVFCKKTGFIILI